jgi:hypothetical protein
MNSSFTPPPNPSADSIQAAYGLLAIAADPVGARKRLDDLVAAHEAITQAHGELQVERKRLVDENARASDLKAKENLLANKQADLEKAATAQAVTAAALQEREQKVSDRERAADKRAADLAAAEQRLADKAAAFRAAIA